MPLKHRSTSAPLGSVPDRSGEKGPSPSRALPVHHLTLDVSAHGHATAHVADDEVQGLIGLADLLGVALGHGLLVQGVENAAAGDEGVAGVAGQRRQFIHHGGIHDVGGDV